MTDAYRRFLSLWTQLDALEWIGVADPVLIHAVQGCSTVDDMGITPVVDPPDTLEEIQNDGLVAHRQCRRVGSYERLRQLGVAHWHVIKSDAEHLPLSALQHPARAETFYDAIAIPVGVLTGNTRTRGGSLSLRRLDRRVKCLRHPVAFREALSLNQQ